MMTGALNIVTKAGKTDGIAKDSAFEEEESAMNRFHLVRRADTSIRRLSRILSCRNSDFAWNRGDTPCFTRNQSD